MIRYPSLRELCHLILLIFIICKNYPYNCYHSEPQSVWMLFVQRVVFTLSTTAPKKATSTREITTPVYPGAVNIPQQALLLLQAFTAWTAEALDPTKPSSMPFSQAPLIPVTGSFSAHV